MRPEKLLIVGGTRETRAYLANALKTDYETAEAEFGEQVIEMMRAKAYSAVLLSLAGVSHEDIQSFLRRRQQDQKISCVPVVIGVNKNIDGSDITEALDAGAWDYISEEASPEAIRMRIRLALQHCDSALSQKLSFLAQYDPVTRLYNKSSLFETVEKLLEDNPGRKFAYVRFDIENFHAVNSMMGLESGDQLLCKMAKAIENYARQYDLCAYGRIEYDIFGIFIPFTPQLKKDIEASRKQLASYSMEYTLIPRFGIYIVEDPSLSAEKINTYACIAAESPQKNGAKCYSFYSEVMEQQLRRQQMLQNDMSKALKEKQFKVYLQPKYSLYHERFVGAEALVRWQHPEEGLIPPGEFIPLFEKNGMISELDYYVWETVCQLLHQWIESGNTPPQISVNVSRMDLASLQIVDKISALVRKYQVPPKYLNLEITESAYSSNPELVKAITAALRLNGFRVLMDDFGSGYSSLSMLKDINIDELKLDMRFFTGTDDGKRGEDIIVAMMHMAKWLHLPVIAEGVEKESQVELLRRAGCEYVQGFYFGKPEPVEKYERILLESASHDAENMNPVTDILDLMQLQNDMFERVLNGMALCDFDGESLNIVHANASFGKLLGRLWDHEPANGDDILQFFEPKVAKDLMTLLYKVEFGRGDVQHDYCLACRDGSCLWASVNMRYLMRADEKCMMSFTMSDITAQKQIQNISK